MGVLESVKERMEKVTGWKRPSRGDLRHAVKSRKPNSFCFKDDGIVPNNPTLPFILYRSPVSLADDFDPAAVFEELFARNGWRNSWRNGIYDYAHYHSGTHEVLGVARGHARVRFGGKRGKELQLKAGDVVVLPAGTGHQRLAALIWVYYSSQLVLMGAEFTRVYAKRRALGNISASNHRPIDAGGADRYVHVAVKRSPYAAALAALLVGWLLARLEVRNQRARGTTSA